MYLVGICVLVLIILYYTMYGDRTEAVVTPSGDKCMVLADYGDRNEAAELLSGCVTDVINFLRYLKVHYMVMRRRADGALVPISDIMEGDSLSNYEPVYPGRITQLVRRMINNFNTQVIYENRPSNGKETSYTVDKGRKMYMCLRDAKTHELHSRDIVLFCMLHEITHIGNSTWGHRMDFWVNFKWVLQNAVKFGIISPVDYAKNPVMYCGMKVSYNPLFDSTVPGLLMQ